MYQLWDKLKNFVIYEIFGVNDTPHRIALGVAVGIFITWMPLVGFQMGLIFFLSALLRANKVVGVPLAWITNPATLWIYIPNYWLGCKLMGHAYNPALLWGALTRAFGLQGSILERFEGLWAALKLVFWPLWWGSCIVASVLAVLAYFGTRSGVTWFKRHRRALQLERQLAEAATDPALPPVATEPPERTE